MLAISQFSRVWVTLFAALASSIILMPLAIKLGGRLGLVSTPRLFGKSEITIPNLGGLAVGTAAAGAFTVAWGVRASVGALLLGTLCVVGLGLADDRSHKFMHRPTVKLAIQVGIASVAWFSGLRSDAGGPLGAFGTILFLVAAMNAFNLLDNMDGVAGTTGAATAAGIGVVALLAGQYTVASLAAAIFGACLGFLPFNFRKARLYLGNGGSLLVGFLIGGAALKLRLPLDYPWTMLAIIALMAVPITDTALIIISRFMHSLPVMQGGVDHVSHRLVKLGLSSTETAVFHGGAALIAAGSVAQAIFGGWPQLIIVTIGLFGCAGVFLLSVRVYEDARIASRLRFVLGVAVLCGILILGITPPVLAGLR